MDKIIQAMAQKIVDRFGPEKVILFGSCARGNANRDSDVDLLVVMPLLGTRKETCLEIRAILREFDVAKDIIVMTPEEVLKYQNVTGTVVRPALREGKTLYDKAA